MPEFRIFGVLLCVWLAACGVHGQSPAALQGEAVRVLAGSADAPADAKRAEALLDQALAQNPRHVPSLLTRSTLRIRQHDYAGALADNDAAIEIRGRTPTLSMMGCMLRERLGAASPTACYGSVVVLYEGDAGPCQEDLNCVVAALMANAPEAGRYRDHYLAMRRAEPDQTIAEGLLRGFKRESYLHSLLP